MSLSNISSSHPSSANESSQSSAAPKPAGGKPGLGQVPPAGLAPLRRVEDDGQISGPASPRPRQHVPLTRHLHLATPAPSPAADPSLARQILSDTISRHRLDISRSGGGEADKNSKLQHLEVLHDRGYTVIEAADGAAALGILRKGPPPDLILLDWYMLPMSGREVAFAYQRLPAPHAPIVVLTAGRDAAWAALRAAPAGEAASCRNLPNGVSSPSWATAS